MDNSVPSGFTPSHRGGSWLAARAAARLRATVACRGTSCARRSNGATTCWRSRWPATRAVRRSRRGPHDTVLAEMWSGRWTPPASARASCGQLARRARGTQLRARSRASVVALAPAGGWAAGDDSYRELLRFQSRCGGVGAGAAPHAEAVVPRARGGGGPPAISRELRAHPGGAARPPATAASRAAPTRPLIEHALAQGWPLDAGRSVPGADRLGQRGQVAAVAVGGRARFREEWLPHADWVELDGVGHCPQLDVPLETAELILRLHLAQAASLRQSPRASASPPRRAGRRRSPRAPRDPERAAPRSPRPEPVSSSSTVAGRCGGGGGAAGRGARACR